jgi:hypothetical protein
MRSFQVRESARVVTGRKVSGPRLARVPVTGLVSNSSPCPAGRWRGMRPLPLPLRGGGRVMRPSAAILFSATRALIARVWPSGRRQSSAWQVASAIAARVGSVAARPVMASMSAGLKSRPQ